MPEPNLRGDSPDNVLEDVDALSAWGSVDQPKALVEHWDGRRWHGTEIASVLRRLNGIATISSTDIWAVGDHVILRYHC